MCINYCITRIKSEKMSTVEVIKSERGKVMLVLDGYKFSFQKKLSNGVQRWICAARKYKCKAFVKTEGPENTIIQLETNHNHEKISEELLNRQKISNNLKRKAVDDPIERPAKLINIELRKEHIETLTHQDVSRIRKNIYHARIDAQPKIPRTLDEIHEMLDNSLILTNKKENFVLRNDKLNNIIMFSCKTNLKYLVEIEEIYVDGTFQYCPKLFYQLFTIHGIKNGHYIPLVFLLLPNKFKRSYELAFNYIKAECFKIGITWSPELITADFEVAIHQAIRTEFPETRIRGCRFHLAQTW